MVIINCYWYFWLYLLLINEDFLLIIHIDKLDFVCIYYLLKIPFCVLVSFFVFMYNYVSAFIIYKILLIICFFLYNMVLEMIVRYWKSAGATIISGCCVYKKKKHFAVSENEVAKCFYMNP